MTSPNINGERFLQDLYRDISNETVSPTVNYGKDGTPIQFCVQNRTTNVVWYGERQSSEEEDDPDGDAVTYRVLRIDPSFMTRRPKPKDFVNPGSAVGGREQELSSCNCQLLSLALPVHANIAGRRLLGLLQDRYNRASVRDHFTVRDGGGLAAMYRRRFR